MAGERRKQSQRMKANSDMMQAPVDWQPGEVSVMDMTDDELKAGMKVLSSDKPILPEQFDPFSDYWAERIPHLLDEMNAAFGFVAAAQEKAVHSDHGLGHILAREMGKAKPPGNIGRAARLSEAQRERIAKATFAYRSAIGKKAQAAGALKRWNTKIWQLDRELKLFEALLYAEGKKR